jgi:hypothetical protein
MTSKITSAEVILKITSTEVILKITSTEVILDIIFSIVSTDFFVSTEIKLLMCLLENGYSNEFLSDSRKKYTIEKAGS